MLVFRYLINICNCSSGLEVITLFTTSGVATFGFEPPITPGLMSPVSSNLNLNNARTSAMAIKFLSFLPGQNFAHTSVGYSKLPGNVARSYAALFRQPYDLPSEVLSVLCLSNFLRFYLVSSASGLPLT